jgi:hypothetical protein
MLGLRRMEDMDRDVLFLKDFQAVGQVGRQL